jgi:hypothetical protein
MALYFNAMDKKAIRHIRKKQAIPVRNLDEKESQKMDHGDRESIISDLREGKEIVPPELPHQPAPVRREKVDYEIREIIRAYPEDYPAILSGLEDFVRRWDNQKN